MMYQRNFEKRQALQTDSDNEIDQTIVVVTKGLSEWASSDELGVHTRTRVLVSKEACASVKRGLY